MGFIKSHPLLSVFVVIVMAVAAAVASTLMNQQQAQSRAFGGGATLVTVEPAQRVELTDQVESVGTALANESVTLTARVTDTVSRIRFEDGMLVNRGDILVELTNSEENALLAEAQATVDESSRQYRRVQNLIESKLASETQLDEERAKMETARARLDAILARLDDRLIRAPFSGLLGFRNVSEGSLLTPTTVVTTLDDISLIKVDFSVPERYLARISQGQEIIATSTAYSGQSFTGAVRTVGSRVDPVTRSVSVRAELANEQRLLRPGMLLGVNLVIDRSPALVVPEEAIIPIQQKTFVYTLGEDGTAERRDIRTGRRERGLVEVLEGIEEGERVVTQGIIKISPGSKVRLREEAGAA